MNFDSVYLLDALACVLRACLGSPVPVHDGAGREVRGALGFWRLLVRHLAQMRPAWGLVAFDESLFSGFRHQLYPGYKRRRVLPDADLAYQIHLSRQLAEALGIRCHASPVYEADDILATAADLARSAGLPVTLVTVDKDLAQLIRPGDLWWNGSTEAPLDHAAVCRRWQVLPAQIPDLLALAGDGVDDIPGVKGVGMKTAQVLVQHLGGLEAIYQQLDVVARLPLRGAARVQAQLAAQQDEAFLFRELIRLHPVREAGMPRHWQALRWTPPDPALLRETLASLALGPAFVQVLDAHGH